MGAYIENKYPNNLSDSFTWTQLKHDAVEAYHEGMDRGLVWGTLFNEHSVDFTPLEYKTDYFSSSNALLNTKIELSSLFSLPVNL